MGTLFRRVTTRLPDGLTDISIAYEMIEALRL